MSFKPSGSLAPWGGPLLRRIVATDSIVLTEDDMSKDTAGFLILGTATAGVLGGVTSIVTRFGVGVKDNGAGANFTNTYTFASTNESTEKAGAMVDVSQMTLYSASLDATIGTTTGSDLLGYYMDLADENQLDESAVTTVAQFHNWGTDPADATRAFVNIFESSVFGDV